MKELALISIFALILIQDMRHRGVHWILFPLLLTAVVIYVYPEFDLKMMGWNLGFLLFMLAVLTLYLSAKYRGWINILDGYFSLGDILFLLAVIPLFAFREYVVFFTIGTCCTLIIHLLSNLVKKQETIPYAGYMALFGIALTGFRETFNQIVNQF